MLQVSVLSPIYGGRVRQTGFGHKADRKVRLHD